jgi:RNA polymerase sigma-70 factor (ECF subfamily)
VSEYPEIDGLVGGIRRRSDRAFSDLYRLTGDALASFAFSMLRDRRAAEDAVQQAFLELVRAAPSLRGDGRSVRAWLFRSVRFSCLDEIRRRSRHPETPAASIPEKLGSYEEIPTPGIDPGLEAALDQLSERQRSLLALPQTSQRSPLA